MFFHRVFLNVVTLFGLLLASMSLAAAQTVCTGQNQISALQQNDKDGWEKIRAKADAIKNGKGRLWRIERNSLEISYLFGTVHVTDPRVNSFPPELVTALDASGTVVVETTDVLDPQKVAAALLAKPEMTMFVDDTTLISLVPENQRAMVKERLTARGIPLVTVQKMKPWLLNGMLSVPACEQRRKAEGEQILDFRLAKEAQKRGIDLKGLETVEEQLSAFMAVSLEEHIELLVANLRHSDRIDDVVATMIDLYLDGDLGAIQPVAEYMAPTDNTADTVSDMEQHVIINRNHVMTDRSVPYLEDGATLIAVGALHLPGDEGVVELLRQKGFTMTPIL